jgi:hypothetical protein
MKRELLPFVLVLSTFAFIVRPGGAAENNFRYSGYVRNFFTYVDSPGGSTLEAFSRLRVSLTYDQSEAINWEVAYEVAPLLRDSTPEEPMLPSPAPLSYRAYDIDETLYPNDDDLDERFILFQNLDRVLFTFTAQHFDLYLGRQSIAFGSARVINPTDILAPFTYNTLVKEERIGVDALRFKTPLGQLGEIDLGVVFGEEFDASKSAAFLRTKTYVMKTDITLMAMYFRENALFGLDLARSIGDAGSWFEAAYVFSDEGNDEDYLTLSIGADYSFTDKLYTYIEYHFNDAGREAPEDYFKARGETAFTDGAVYLLGRHYVAPGVRYLVSPLLIVVAQALINLSDGSVLASPALEYNLAEDIYLELGVFLGIGDGPTVAPVPETEFGLYPDVYFASLNIYF